MSTSAPPRVLGYNSRRPGTSSPHHSPQPPARERTFPGGGGGRQRAGPAAGERSVGQPHLGNRRGASGAAPLRPRPPTARRRRGCGAAAAASGTGAGECSVRRRGTPRSGAPGMPLPGKIPPGVLRRSAPAAAPAACGRGSAGGGR